MDCITLTDNSSKVSYSKEDKASARSCVLHHSIFMTSFSTCLNEAVVDEISTYRKVLLISPNLLEQATLKNTEKG